MQRLVQPGSVAFSAGETVVHVDQLRVNAEGLEGMALGGEVLGVGRTAGVTDEHASDCSERIGPLHRAIIRTGYTGIREWLKHAEVETAEREYRSGR